MVYQFLQRAEVMFAEYDLPEGEGGVTWNNQKLEHYLNLQYRLVDEHPCVSNRTSPDPNTELQLLICSLVCPSTAEYHAGLRGFIAVLQEPDLCGGAAGVYKYTHSDKT